MARKPQYRTLRKSEIFENQAEAKAWAAEQKKRLRATEQGVRIEIDYLEGRNGWQARILLLVKRTD